MGWPVFSIYSTFRNSSSLFLLLMMSSSRARVLGEESNSRFRLWAPSSPHWASGGMQEDGACLVAWQAPWAAPWGLDMVSSFPALHICQEKFRSTEEQRSRWKSDFIILFLMLPKLSMESFYSQNFVQEDYWLKLLLQLWSDILCTQK